MRKIFIVLFVFLSSLCSVFGQDMESNFKDSVSNDNHEEGALLNKIFILADSLFENKLYHKSLSMYKRVVSLAPSSKRAKNRIDEIYLLQNKFEEVTDSNIPQPVLNEGIVTNAKAFQERRIDAFQSNRIDY